MEALASRCPDLATLSVEGAGSVSDDGIHLLATGCRRLTSLDVSLTGISADGLAAAIAIPSLESLNVSGCAGCTGDLPHAALRSSSLVALVAASCPAVSASTAQAIVRGMPRLATLDICGSTIGDGGLADIVSDAPSLRTLYIGGCDAVTSKGVAVAVVRAPHVKIFR
jgi:hypothetical protein